MRFSSSSSELSWCLSRDVETINFHLALCFWLWYPGLSPVLVSIALPFAFHISVFLFTLLHQPLDFIRLFFTVAVSTPHHQPSSLSQTWDWHYGNWISEKVQIPWWWSYEIMYGTACKKHKINVYVWHLGKGAQISCFVPGCRIPKLRHCITICSISSFVLSSILSILCHSHI